jgi:hypothetical protein
MKPASGIQKMLVQSVNVVENIWEQKKFRQQISKSGAKVP